MALTKHPENEVEKQKPFFAPEENLWEKQQGRFFPQPKRMAWAGFGDETKRFMGPQT